MHYPSLVTLSLVCLSLTANAAPLPLPGGTGEIPSLVEKEARDLGNKLRNANVEKDAQEFSDKLRNTNFQKLLDVIEGKDEEKTKWTRWEKLALATMLAGAVGNAGFVVSGAITTDHLRHQYDEIQKLKSQMNQVQGQQQQQASTSTGVQHLPGTQPSNQWQRRGLNDKSEIEEKEQFHTPRNSFDLRDGHYVTPGTSFRADRSAMTPSQSETHLVQNAELQRLLSMHDNEVSQKANRLLQLKSDILNKARFKTFTPSQQAELKAEAASILSDLKEKGIITLDASRGLSPLEKTLAVGSFITAGVFGVGSAIFAIGNTWLSYHGPIAQGAKAASEAGSEAGSAKHN